MQKKFYWCISYKIAGYPRPDKSWLFNSNPLNLSESIQDFEVSSKSFFVYEGKHLNVFSLYISHLPFKVQFLFYPNNNPLTLPLSQTHWVEYFVPLPLPLCVRECARQKHIWPYFKRQEQLTVKLINRCTSFVHLSVSGATFISLCLFLSLSHLVILLRLLSSRSVSLILSSIGYLQIEKATPSNDGLYTLLLRNEFGTANLSVEAQFHKGQYFCNCIIVISYVSNAIVYVLRESVLPAKSARAISMEALLIGFQWMPSQISFLTSYRGILHFFLFAASFLLFTCTARHARCLQTQAPPPPSPSPSLFLSLTEVANM